jgi:putative chitinase
VTALRKPVFDAIRAQKGSILPVEVPLIDDLLDQLGFDADGKQTLTDPAAFFRAVRANFGSLDQDQVDGINALLAGMGEAGWAIAWTAYGLATAWHETAKRMQPVREGLNASDAWHRKHLARYYPWYGRGHVQTTWERNYRHADKALGLSGRLIADADLMLTNEVSIPTMVRGMSEGWFTGKSLGDYLDSERGTFEEFKAARRIINGTDKDELIAGYAQRFQAALQAGGWA